MRQRLGQELPGGAEPRSDVAVLTKQEFQQALLNAINDASPEGILVVDGHGLIVSYNQRILDVWGIPEELMDGVGVGSAIGTVDDPLLSSVCDRAKDPTAFRARVRELHYTPALDDNCEIELKDGRTLARVSTALYGKQSEYLGRVWFYRDITAEREARTRLQVLARQDPLTGIMNRRYFTERAEQEFARAAREGTSVALVMFDLDHFKRINDQYGHAAGDKVLRHVCDTCRTMVRQTSLFARIGGEEFVILLSPANQEGALLFAERLRAAVAAATVLVGADDVSVTISIGVAMRDQADDTPDACLLRADQAMYAAKAGGRNRVELASRH